MKKEIWKDIPGYENIYQVSDLGRVRSLKFNKSKVLKNLYVEAKKYPFVILSLNNIRKEYKIHILVALVFIGDRPKNYYICHKDGDKFNNKLTNLRYDTSTQNQIDEYRQGKKSSQGKLSIEQVLEIKALLNSKKHFQKDIAGMYNVSRRTICDISCKNTFSWLNDDGTINESKTSKK